MDWMNEELFTHFSDAVDAIYAASLEPAIWPRAVEKIARLHGCSGLVLLTPTTAPADGGFIVPFGISEPFLQVWATKYVKNDPFVEAAVRRKLYFDGSIMLSDDLLPRSDLEASEWYRDFFAPAGGKYFCTAAVFGVENPHVLPTSCSLINGPNSRDYDERDRKILKLLVVHLSRALGTMFRLRDAEFRIANTLGALDRLRGGVVLFGARGNVEFANAAATDIFRRGDGLSCRSGALSDGAGWLHAKHASDETALQVAVKTSLQTVSTEAKHFSRGIAVSRAIGQRPDVVYLSSLGHENQFSKAVERCSAIGFIHDPDKTLYLDAALLAQVFGISPAETRLAQALLSGATLNSASQDLGISENTAKSQLASIFAKTETHRQSELIALLTAMACDVCDS